MRDVCKSATVSCGNTELLSEHTILGPKLLDHLLLLAIDAAGQDQDQQLPELQKGLHIRSGCCAQRGSIRDLPVNRRKQWSLQPLAARLSFFTSIGRCEVTGGPTPDA